MRRKNKMETLKLTREELKEFIGFPDSVWGVENIKQEDEEDEKF